MASENEVKEIGQYAYEAYCAHTDKKSLVTGDDLPKWDNLSTNIQDAWNAAGNAIIEVALHAAVDAVNQAIVE